jgi:hypothetical protein
MTVIEQLTAEIYRAIDQFEKETGLLISAIYQQHETEKGIPILINREMKISAVNRSIY